MKYVDHVLVATAGYGFSAGLLFDTMSVGLTAGMVASIVYAMVWEVLPRGRA